MGGGKYDGVIVGFSSLKILFLIFEDEGIYRCLVISSVGFIISGFIFFIVIGSKYNFFLLENDRLDFCF